MSIELKITAKNEEKKLTKDFNLYDVVTLSVDDPVISKCIQEVRKEFLVEVDDIIVNAKMFL